MFYHYHSLRVWAAGDRGGGGGEGITLNLSLLYSYILISILSIFLYSFNLGSSYHYHSLRKWAAGGAGAGGCGGGGEGITLNLHKITPDIKSCAMFERLFEKKSDLQSIYSFARNKRDGGIF